MKKFFLGFTGLLVVLALAIFIFRNAVLKSALKAAVTNLTGFETEIEALRYDLPAVLQINGLRIHNPQGFKNKIFADVPEIYINFDLNALLGEKRVHIREIKLYIEEVHIEKNGEGITNVSRLSPARSSAETPVRAPSEKKVPPDSAPVPFLLDRFELTLRTVSFEDHSSLRQMARGIVPNKVSVDMKVEKQVFENIRDPQALVNLVLLKIVYGTTFGNLIGLRPDNLRQTLTGAVGSGREFVGETADLVTEKAGRWVSGATGTAGREAQGLLSSEPLGDAKSTLTGAAQATKGKISGLFNKLKSGEE